MRSVGLYHVTRENLSRLIGLVVGLLILLLLIPHSFLLRAALVGDFGVRFEHTEPAEEKGRHNHQVYHSWNEQHRATGSLVTKGGDAELRWYVVERVDHHEGEDEQK